MDSRSKNKGINKEFKRNTSASASFKWSTIPGVQMLELTKLSNFAIVRDQLHSVLKSEFGELADFLMGHPLFQPEPPNIELIKDDLPDLTEEQVNILYLDDLKKYRSRQREIKQVYVKIFGKIMVICDTNLKERLKRMDDYVVAAINHDCHQLWLTISSIVGDDGTDFDPTTKTFSEKWVHKKAC